MEQRISWLKVSENKRFLTHEDGKPFFWLGDTAWELFHRLNREEVELYLSNRAELGFTVIQAVALAEFGGITMDNAYGRCPLKQNESGRYDPSRPDLGGEYDYWQHVDFIVDTAASKGIYIALLPTWGDKYHQAWGEGPEIFNAENAGEYGQWLGNRYRDKANVIWVLGGDRPLTRMAHFQVIRSMAEGLKAGDKGRHLMTFHPPGASSSSRHVHDEAWLDFNMIQSGHSEGVRVNDKLVAEDYALIPVKPTLDGEPCYEDHPRGFKAENGYFDQADVRHAAYYAVFAGGFGHTYGHHAVWSMTTDPKDYYVMTWQDALMRPGAAQMRHLRSLMESRTFLDRVPDQSLIAEDYPGSNHMAATRGEKYAMIYFPNGVRAGIVMGRLPGERVMASWYDPRSGNHLLEGPIVNEGIHTFTPPSSGRGNDWVLLLDSVQPESE